MTMEDQLLTLYARLKKEAERCTIYAMRAKKDGKNELSHLFRALAVSQNMQAQRFLVQIRGGVSSTDINEQTAFSEEIPAFIKHYEQMLIDAEQEGNKALETGFKHSKSVQQRNLDLHAHLSETERDAEYYVCDFCGYITEGEPPDNCPVCTAPKKRFLKVNTD